MSVVILKPTYFWNHIQNVFIDILNKTFEKSERKQSQFFIAFIYIVQLNYSQMFFGYTFLIIFNFNQILQNIYYSLTLLN